MFKSNGDAGSDERERNSKTTVGGGREGNRGCEKEQGLGKRVQNLVRKGRDSFLLNQGVGEEKWETHG